MKRQSQPMLSEDGQRALNQYAQVLQLLEDLSPVTTRNYLSDLRQFIAWCECSWRERQEDRFFTPQAVAPSLLIRYREYLQTMLGLKPSTVNRTLMSLKRYFAWTRKVQIIQSNPASLIKFLPKEAASPRHLDNDEEDALVAAVNTTGTLRDQTMITLLLHTGLRAQELCTLTRQQIHLGKRNGILRIMGKRKKVREVPLNATARSILNQYLGTLPQECQYLFPSEKTHHALTGRALGHLVTKYVRKHRSLMSVLMTCAIALAIEWQRSFLCTGSPRLWGMTRWILPCFIFAGRSKISNRMWRRSHGYSLFSLRMSSHRGREEEKAQNWEKNE